MDCSLPGFSVHGILQARTLEWVAVSFSKVHCRRTSMVASVSLTWKKIFFFFPSSFSSLFKAWGACSEKKMFNWYVSEDWYYTRMHHKSKWMPDRSELPRSAPQFRAASDGGQAFPLGWELPSTTLIESLVSRYLLPPKLSITNFAKK